MPSTLVVDNLQPRTGNVITVPSGKTLYAPGSVVQIQQAVKSDTFTSNSSSWLDITGLSVSITPFLTTSKILVKYSVQTSIVSGGYACLLKLQRNGVDIGVGVPTSSAVATTTQAFSDAATASGYPIYNQTMEYLDSPISVTTLTYKIQARGWVSSSGSYYINMSQQDLGTVNFGRGISTITVMEIAQ